MGELFNFAGVFLGLTGFSIAVFYAVKSTGKDFFLFAGIGVVFIGVIIREVLTCLN